MSFKNSFIECLDILKLPFIVLVFLFSLIPDYKELLEEQEYEEKKQKGEIG